MFVSLPNLLFFSCRWERTGADSGVASSSAWHCRRSSALPLTRTPRRPTSERAPPFDWCSALRTPRSLLTPFWVHSFIHQCPMLNKTLNSLLILLYYTLYNDYFYRLLRGNVGSFRYKRGGRVSITAYAIHTYVWYKGYNKWCTSSSMKALNFLTSQ